MSRLMIFTLAALCSAAVAAAPANFSGEWKLDKSRSDTMAPMLERCGFSWFERKGAAAFPATVTIVDGGERLAITNHTMIGDVKTVTLLTGKPHMVETPMGPMIVRARRTDGGAVITAQSVTTCERNDVKMKMANTRRFLKSKDEMLLVLDVTLEDGSHKKMRRVFIRQK